MFRFSAYFCEKYTLIYTPKPLGIFQLFDIPNFFKFRDFDFLKVGEKCVLCV